jgi:hypothetical protein
MQMRTVVVDKIASIAQACGLGHEIRVATTDFPCEEGVVLVVEILDNKSTYNTLELTSGRMAKVSRGDVIVGALGHRQALFGYSGHIPEKVTAGDVLQVLLFAVLFGCALAMLGERGRPVGEFIDTLGHVLTNTWSFRLEPEPETAANVFVFGSPPAQRMGQKVRGPATWLFLPIQNIAINCRPPGLLP